MSDLKVRTLNEEARHQVSQWLEGRVGSYFDVRPFVSSFDLGLAFLLRGNFSYFLKKLTSAGSIQIEPRFAEVVPPRKSDSYALVVTFNPDQAVKENIRRLMQQFAHVVIVDNSPVHRAEFFSDLISADVTLLLNQNYNGLAGALSKGTREVYRLKKTGWIFWFDQDTEIYPMFLSEIETLTKKMSMHELQQALFGTNYESPNQPVFETETIDVKAVITSGSFMRIENLQRTGLFVDEMFIDSVDHEFCLRAERVGMRVRMITKILMKHSLGRMETGVFLWKKNIMFTNHAPFRWYYFHRNLVFTVFDGFPTSLPWFFAHWISLVKNYIKVLLFEKQKVRKTAAVILGTLDGILLIFRNKGLFRKLI